MNQRHPRFFEQRKKCYKSIEKHTAPHKLKFTVYTPNVDLQLDDTADESARIDLTEHRPAIDVRERRHSHVRSHARLGRLGARPGTA